MRENKENPPLTVQIAMANGTGTSLEYVGSPVKDERKTHTCINLYSICQKEGAVIAEL